LILAVLLVQVLALALALALLTLLAAPSAELVLQFLLSLLDRELLGFVLQIVELAQASDPGNPYWLPFLRFRHIAGPVRHTAGPAYPLLIV
jgi:hypothetical protein